ncbi:MAG: FAD:protein FMN transferase [Anaerolineaceae bacterium]|nr:FAD:protein FMN transferase [Anaerolineaceae bacterium]
MNTSILLAASGRPEEIEVGFQHTEAFIRASEQRFTRFSDESELAHLNRSAGEWFLATDDLYEVVQTAVKFHGETGKLFDPGILPALERAGYDRSMDELRAHGGEVQTVPVALKQAEFDQVELDPDCKRIRLPSGLKIDLGGIAKGWIAERAAQVLSEFSQACAVDAGGDAFMIGIPIHSETWRISLEDPGDSSRTLAVLKVHPGAIATSAITKRRWQQGDKTHHHLIDPRTQQPADTDWLSVTVVANHAAQAEVYAKCLLIGGSQEVNEISNRATGIEFIAVDQHKRMWGSQHSRELLDV